MAGVVLAALFIAGALAVGRIEALAAPVQELLLNASGSAIGLTLVVTLVNGVAEELFFRNTVPRHLPGLNYPLRIAVAVGLYVAVTAAMLVPLLAVAAVAVGLVAHLEVRATGALISAIVMHATWAMGMLLVLPVVLAA
ncbi:CPBP family glutamic-type intramembrane protease [Corynebacterium guangdongense]|uniref:Membrane protease YdiL (CAAX protease family) n=1 Tax=Corynebacterium guangdongense TaxID=1783348 RepID=A0ABU1ZY98_9CORY|nr:CPBP family glutamic-type intramembrane protease [Corynebacterium guangdongense]MDR7329876.1 membrane protease YdiL (CAAX protease family) [Corynebacterium guangdongense]